MFPRGDYKVPKYYYLLIFFFTTKIKKPKTSVWFRTGGGLFHYILHKTKRKDDAKYENYDDIYRSVE